MSSPLNRSNSRSSPARPTPNGFRRSQTNGYHSPLRHSTESPSRQLAEEFSKVYLDEERLYRKRLDDQSDEQEKLHREALSKSLQKHEEVRQSVERAQERLQLELDRVKRERQAQEQAALEEARKKAAEAEAAAKQRELEQAKRQEEELKQAAAREQELEETQKRIDAQKKQEADEKAKRETERVKQQEAEEKAREDAIAAEKAKASAPAPAPAPTTAQPQVQAQPQQNGTSASMQPSSSGPATTGPTIAAGTGALTPNGIQTTAEAKEAEHKRYLDLHARLKQMCVETEAKYKSQGLKDQLSNLRRELVKVVGQTNKHDKEANRVISLKVREMFERAGKMNAVTVDVTPYLVSVEPAKVQASASSTQCPAALLYAFHHFVKAVFSQLVAEGSRDPKAADPIGILVVSTFAFPNHCFNNFSLIDILWAKFHKVCPVLFGIYGPQQTFQGRRRLGWRASNVKDDNGNPTNKFEEIEQADHYDRMTGFAAGFSAIALRDFSKSQNANPAPNHLFWTALARILNVPNNEQTSTHYHVLNNMLRTNTNRFIQFYGGAAIAALRKAVFEFPAGGGPLGANGKPESVVLAVKGLYVVFRTEFNLTL